jgi:hypothetical protein
MDFIISEETRQDISHIKSYKQRPSMAKKNQATAAMLCLSVYLLDKRKVQSRKGGITSGCYWSQAD